MAIDPHSPRPQFDPGHDCGVAQAALNVAAGYSLSDHLRAAVDRQKSIGRFVAPSLIAFAEQLAAAAIQAAGVLAGTERPTDPDSVDEVKPSPAPFFSISVAEDGLIDIEATTKMALMLSQTLRDYRDWRGEQGFSLPGDIAAFGAEMGNLARVARPVLPAKPVIQLPPQPAGRPLAKFMRPQTT